MSKTAKVTPAKDPPKKPDPPAKRPKPPRFLGWGKPDQNKVQLHRSNQWARARVGVHMDHVRSVLLGLPDNAGKSVEIVLNGKWAYGLVVDGSPAEAPPAETPAVAATGTDPDAPIELAEPPQTPTKPQRQVDKGRAIKMRLDKAAKVLEVLLASGKADPTKDLRGWAAELLSRLGSVSASSGESQGLILASAALRAFHVALDLEPDPKDEKAHAAWAADVVAIAMLLSKQPWDGKLTAAALFVLPVIAAHEGKTRYRVAKSAKDPEEMGLLLDDDETGAPVGASGGMPPEQAAQFLGKVLPGIASLRDYFAGEQPGALADVGPWCDALGAKVLADFGDFSPGSKSSRSEQTRAAAWMLCYYTIARALLRVKPAAEASQDEQTRWTELCYAQLYDPDTVDVPRKRLIDGLLRLILAIVPSKWEAPTPAAKVAAAASGGSAPAGSANDGDTAPSPQAGASRAPRPPATPPVELPPGAEHGYATSDPSSGDEGSPDAEPTPLGGAADGADATPPGGGETGADTPAEPAGQGASEAGDDGNQVTVGDIEDAGDTPPGSGEDPTTIALAVAEDPPAAADDAAASDTTGQGAGEGDAAHEAAGAEPVTPGVEDGLSPDGALPIDGDASETPDPSATPTEGATEPPASTDGDDLQLVAEEPEDTDGTTADGSGSHAAPQADQPPGDVDEPLRLVEPDPTRPA